MKISIPVIDVLCVRVRLHLHPLTNGPRPHSVTLAIPVSICAYVGNFFVAQEVTERRTNTAVRPAATCIDNTYAQKPCTSNALQTRCRVFLK